MADYEDTKVTDLVINNMSQEKFDELKAAGELDPTQIYLTPTEESGGALANTATQTDSLAILGTTNAPNSIAIGANAAAGSPYGTAGGSIAIGVGSQSGAGGLATRAIAVGQNATASTTGAIAIGWNAKVNGNQTPIAIGYGCTASGAGSIILGAYGTNTEPHTFAVSLYKDSYSANVYTLLTQDGTIPTDRYTTTPTTAGTYVPKLTIAGDGTATREWGAESGGGLTNASLATNGLAIGGTTLDNASNATAIGFGSSVLGTYSTAVGANASTNTQRGVAIGYAAAGDYGGTAIGASSSTSGSYSIAIGGRASASGSNSIQINASGTTKTNSDANTFKVANANGNFEIMDANGNVPRERLKNLVEVLPTADNGYTTVKNYGNGYVEITGYTAIGTVGASTGSEVQIDLPAGYTMANANYWVNIAPTSETTMFDFKAEAKARSTTHFMVAYKNEDTTTGLTAAGVYWEVRGMLATE